MLTCRAGLTGRRRQRLDGVDTAPALASFFFLLREP